MGIRVAEKHGIPALNLHGMTPERVLDEMDAIVRDRAEGRTQARRIEPPAARRPRPDWAPVAALPARAATRRPGDRAPPAATARGTGLTKGRRAATYEPVDAGSHYLGRFRGGLKAQPRRVYIQLRTCRIRDFRRSAATR